MSAVSLFPARPAAPASRHADAAASAGVAGGGTEYEQVAARVADAQERRGPAGDRRDPSRAEAAAEDRERAEPGDAAAARDAESWDTDGDVDASAGATESGKVDAEKADAEKADAEKADAEKADAEKADAEKADAEEADAEVADAEKADTDRAGEVAATPDRDDDTSGATRERPDAEAGNRDGSVAAEETSDETAADTSTRRGTPDGATTGTSGDGSGGKAESGSTPGPDATTDPSASAVVSGERGTGRGSSSAPRPTTGAPATTGAAAAEPAGDLEAATSPTAPGADADAGQLRPEPAPAAAEDAESPTTPSPATATASAEGEGAAPVRTTPSTPRSTAPAPTTATPASSSAPDAAGNPTPAPSTSAAPPPAVASAATPAGATVGLQGDPWEQVATVVRPLRHAPDGSHRLSLQLRPAELGTVHLEVAVQDGRLSLRAVTDNAMSRDLLTGALPELRAQLTDAGVDLGSLDVSEHTGSDDDQWGSDDQRPSGHPGEHSLTTTLDTNSTGVEAGATGATPHRVAAGSLDLAL